MNSPEALGELLQRRAQRLSERRSFLKMAGTASAVIGGSALLGGCFGDDDDDNRGNGGGMTPPTAELTDADVLNFALNLEYLEAQFYAYAATGSGLDASLLGGTGTQGAVSGGRKVAFTDPVVAQYAREIAGDELAHVAFLRSALKSSAVAMPAIDVSADAAGAFSAAARAAGLVGEGQAFDPYASDENFLLAAYIFEDVGVTAYKGAAPLIESKTYLEAAAGILAAEAYHAGLIRTVLYRKGLETPALISAAKAISDARDSLDGPSPLDQPLRVSGDANIVPTDQNGIALSRTTGQVLDIVYLTNQAATKGGFFPNGVNGTINASTAA
jgi:hypothetical protein